LEIEKLVKAYQGSDLDFIKTTHFDNIKKQLQGEINYILTAHGLGKRQAAFTRLDGETAKSPRRGRSYVIKPGDAEYNENEPQQMDLICEENFTAADRQQLIDNSLFDALITYEPDQGGFKAWFKIKFSDDIKDLQKEYKDYWQGKPKAVNLQRYDNKHKNDPARDYSRLYETMPADYLNRLKDDHKRLLLIRERAGQETLFKKDEAALMGIGESKRDRLQSELEKEFKEWLWLESEKVKPEKIEPRNYFNISDPTPYQADKNM
jgi:hypothetical protein